jgi:NAD(P)H-hydrate epimerase
MGQSPDAKSRVMRLIRLGKPMIIDADAVNILAAQKRWPREFKSHAILTPHPGEMKRLGKFLGMKEIPKDDGGRRVLATSVASAFGQIVVLKGDRTIVSDGKRTYTNDTGNSALSKAGTGDVLSGIIASLVGQKMDPFDAACAGVRIHGLAGEVAGTRFGLRSALARDVIDAIPEAIALYEKREL